MVDKRKGKEDIIKEAVEEAKVAAKEVVEEVLQEVKDEVIYQIQGLESRILELLQSFKN